MEIDKKDFTHSTFSDKNKEYRFKFWLVTKAKEL